MVGLLKTLKAEANRFFLKWVLSGCHEADDELNDGNRSIIRKYSVECPKMLGYKFHVGIIQLNMDKLTNFCCDYVFNGTTENIEIIKSAEKCNEQGMPEPIMRALDNAEGICLYWS